MHAVPPAGVDASPQAGILAPLDRLSYRRRTAASVGLALGKDPMTRDIAQRIGNCALRLALALEEQDDGKARALITSGMFCQTRLCPLCEWRRARAWRGRLTAGLTRFAEAYPKHRGLFLTLTVRNVPVHQTREAIKELHAGFRSMTRTEAWPTPFWLRRTEVTVGQPSFTDGLPKAPENRGSRKRGTEGMADITKPPGISSARVASPYGLWAHPHIHALLMVPAGYWARGYIRQTGWQSLWSAALGLDYAPIVDIRPARAKDGREALKDAAQDAVMEAAKYITKANQVASLGPLAPELHQQLKGQRMIQLSQALGKFVRDGDITPEEMLDVDEVQASTLPMFHTVVQWDSFRSEYTIAP